MPEPAFRGAGELAPRHPRAPGEADPGTAPDTDDTEGLLRVGRLRVGLAGAGLWLGWAWAGYCVHGVERRPGQPDLHPGDVVVAIGGRVLVGLGAEEVERRFGEAFADGALFVAGPVQQLVRRPVEQVRAAAERAIGEVAFKRDYVPQRVLTKPCEPAHNSGRDNIEFDYICRVRDTIESDSGRSFEILDWLGRGTCGQVLKCQVRDRSQTQIEGGIVALKVIGSKPAYTEQARVEVKVLQKLNDMFEPTEEDRFVRMLEHFTFHNHVCIAFELLDENLYQELQRRGHRGLSLANVHRVTGQLLEALARLRDASIIHGDLKPENVMLCCQNPIRVKLIDFGSASHGHQPPHSYIQSRFYRSPEVLLGLTCTRAIDIWSLGCVCAEVFWGLPLLPGVSSYDQIRRVVRVLGAPPAWMLEVGHRGTKYFRREDGASGGSASTSAAGCNGALEASAAGGAARPVGASDRAPAGPDAAATPLQVGRRGWRLKSPDEFRDECVRQQLEDRGLVPSASQQEKEIRCLDHLMQVVEPKVGRGASEQARLLEQDQRLAFQQLLEGLLAVCPEARWTTGQALRHPFVTTAPHVADFRPAKDEEDTASRALRSEPGSLSFDPLSHDVPTPPLATSCAEQGIEPDTVLAPEDKAEIGCRVAADKAVRRHDEALRELAELEGRSGLEPLQSAELQSQREAEVRSSARELARALAQNGLRLAAQARVQ